MCLFFWLVCFCFLSFPIFSADEIDIKKIYYTTIPTSHFAQLFPEQEQGFTANERETALILFQYAGRNIDNDPNRSEVCKRAFGRFIDTFPNHPLPDLLNCMQMGLSLSPTDQMTDFYLTGIGRVYAEALRRYPDDKALVYESMSNLFTVVYDIPDYKELMNTVLADLLRNQCIASAIAYKLLRQRFTDCPRKETSPQWLSKENENELSILIDGPQG